MNGRNASAVHWLGGRVFGVLTSDDAVFALQTIGIGLSLKGTMELVGPCDICGQLVSYNHPAQECWVCGVLHHYRCIELTNKEGPYYCNACKLDAAESGF